MSGVDVCTGKREPKRCQAIIGLIIVLAQTQKVLDDQRSADVLTHPRSCKYSQQRATTCWPDLCNSAQIFFNLMGPRYVECATQNRLLVFIRVDNAHTHIKKVIFLKCTPLTPFFPSLEKRLFPPWRHRFFFPWGPCFFHPWGHSCFPPWGPCFFTLWGPCFFSL